MKRILFVIDSLVCGGAEKSLVSLLETLSQTEYTMDLMLLKRGGVFESLIPNNVNIVEPPYYYRYLQGEKVKSIFSLLKCKFYRIYTSILLRLLKNKYSVPQIIFIGNRPAVQNEFKKLNYDVAVAYSQGVPTYIVADLIKAKKKFAWINCDYINTTYNKSFDYNYYKKVDYMVAVSKYVYDSLSAIKSEYKQKRQYITDIINPKIILSSSELKKNNEVSAYSGFKIVTVGRLEWVKGYNLVVKAAKILKQNGLNFKWFIIGEGPERKNIEQEIATNHLENTICLLGLKANPYPYMKSADLYVQTSLKEGLGLTVIEAMILNKAIVCTNFTTANELINNHCTGEIVAIDANSIANKIIELYNDHEKISSLENNLKNSKKYDTTSEAKKFIDLIK
ncbi:MAG: glycosyltransferase [Eubacterium sp.]